MEKIAKVPMASTKKKMPPGMRKCLLALKHERSYQFPGKLTKPMALKRKAS
jgi:hypothetical protein